MSINSGVFFTIIIPVYNKEKYIRRTLSSVFNQDYKNYEVIIVDDGSYDNTANILKEYEKNKNVIILTHQTNESLHISRMDGVAAANGEFIIFLDGDDYFSDYTLSRLHDIISGNQGYEIYEYGYIEQPLDVKIFPVNTDNKRFLSYFQRNNYPLHSMCNKAFKAEIIKKAFCTMSRIYLNEIEDIYEAIIIAFYAENYYYINETFLNYSIGTGISTSYKNIDSTIKYLNSVKKMLINTELFITSNRLNICLNDLKYRLLKYTIETYINKQQNHEDKLKLFLVLSEYFESNILLEFAYYRESDFNDILKITNSRIFKFCKYIKNKTKKIF